MSNDAGGALWWDYATKREQVPIRDALYQVQESMSFAGGDKFHDSKLADHKMEAQYEVGGGENTITAFAIDATTGEPKLIQHADTHSFHVRTFAFDPSGRLLVAASIKPMNVRAGNDVTTVPARLSVFRCSADGKLDFVRAYDVDTTGKTHYWMTIVGLAATAE